mmetsp:Transcript_24320/g.41810  ORF Transcript_24320/g.41810 Transcript_24320/m.41810 type:complete len:96 (-) Transcript_24320:615-902(-)
MIIIEEDHKQQDLYHNNSSSKASYDEGTVFTVSMNNGTTATNTNNKGTIIHKEQQSIKGSEKSKHILSNYILVLCTTMASAFFCHPPPIVIKNSY